MIKHNQFWDYEHIIERKGYFSLLEKSWLYENFDDWRCIWYFGAKST
jgi:hypothetical protein